MLKQFKDGISVLENSRQHVVTDLISLPFFEERCFYYSFNISSDISNIEKFVQKHSPTLFEVLYLLNMKQAYAQFYSKYPAKGVFLLLSFHGFVFRDWLINMRKQSCTFGVSMLCRTLFNHHLHFQPLFYISERLLFSFVFSSKQSWNTNPTNWTPILKVQ